MKTFIYSITLVHMAIVMSFSQIAEFESNDQGFVLPRVLDTASISTTIDGMIIYSLIDSSLYLYNGVKWDRIADLKIQITGGGATNVSGNYPNFNITSTDNVNDADASPTNELQSISLSGNILSLSSGGGSVNLSSFEPPWTSSGSNLYYNTGNVGIGDNSPVSTLTVGDGDKFQVKGSDGDIILKDDQGTLQFANSIGSNAPMIQMFTSGTNNSTRMFLAHSNSFQTWGIRYNDTSDAFTWIGDDIPVMHVQLAGSRMVGIGTDAPEAKLHIKSNSGTGAGQLKLTETQSDFSRITLNNTIESDYWDIAARTDATSSGTKFNIYHSTAGDILSVTGEKRVGINDNSPSWPLEVNGNGETRAINVYNNLPATTGSSSNYGVYANLSQSSNTGSPRLYNLYGTSTDVDAYLSYGVYGSATNASNFNYGVFGNASTTSGYAGYFSGNTYCTGSYLPSDQKLKSDIQPLTNGLSQVMNLRPKTYRYDIQKYDFMHLPEGQQFGFLAQDLEEQLPMLTKRSFQGYEDPISDSPEDQGLEFKAINYIALIPIMVSAIQEQQQLIHDQKNEIMALGQKVNDLQVLISQSGVTAVNLEP